MTNLKAASALDRRDQQIRREIMDAIAKATKSPLSFEKQIPLLQLATMNAIMISAGVVHAKLLAVSDPDGPELAKRIQEIEGELDQFESWVGPLVSSVS